MSDHNTKQLDFVRFMERVQGGQDVESSPETVRNQRCLQQQPSPSAAAGVAPAVSDHNQEKLLLPQSPSAVGANRAPSLLGKSLRSIDVVRHLQSTDSFEVKFTTDESDCSVKREYLRLVYSAGVEPLPEYTDMDVLPGPGKGNQHLGNQEYLGMIEARVPEYQTADNQKKNKLAEEVINLVIKNGSRFYHKEEEGYMELTDKDMLLEKVKNAFRGRIKFIRKHGTKT